MPRRADHRARATVTIVTSAAVALVLLAGCVPAGPAPSAASYFAAWARNDRAGVNALSSVATDAATMFTRAPYLAPALHFRNCTEGDAHVWPRCFWDDGLHRLELDPNDHRVDGVSWTDVYTGTPTAAIPNSAWGLYLSWLHNDRGRAATYATPTSVSALFAADRSHLDRLDYVACLPTGTATGTHTCTFTDGTRVVRLGFGQDATGRVTVVTIAKAPPLLPPPVGVTVTTRHDPRTTISWSPRAGALGYVVTVTNILSQYPGSEIASRTFVTTASTTVDSQVLEPEWTVDVAAVAPSGIGVASPEVHTTPDGS